LISLLIECPPEQRDRLIAELWEAGTLGVIETESFVEAFFDDASAATAFAAWRPRVVEQEDVDWVQATQDSFPPVRIGQRFFLAPPWCADATPDGRFRLVINPGSACGTGYHACTQLCLAAMERWIRPGDRVADIGTGSGILAVAAQQLGASWVAGCDIDPEAIAESIAPLRFTGSADALADQSVDVVVANISAAANQALLADYRRITRPGGRWILSGFEEWAFPGQVIETTPLGDWLCYVVQL
jgi:ribosomal protein L11 methyltransferase